MAGISHKDLLLNSDITLPILQVRIELTRFFLFAPILLVLLHMGLIGQLVLLARKTLEFAASIRMLESTDQRTHPLRLELDNFFFVQAIAGPERSRIVSFFLKACRWLTLVVMPLLLLLYIQLVFLPYHDVAVTWVHRDRAAGRHRAAGVRRRVPVARWRPRSSARSGRPGVHHPLGLTATAGCCSPPSPPSRCSSPPFRARAVDAAARQANGRAAGRFWAMRCPASAWRPRACCSALFHRNLNVIDVDLVVDKDATPGEPSLNLRGRDLRNAKLDRTDLHQADLTGADLDGASLVGSDLRGAWMRCADLNELLLTDSRSAARCVSARGANLSKARLSGARMAGIDLRGARLEAAQLDGAQLSLALMGGANLAGARLDLADLTGASLHGANLLLASLQGAEPAGAKAPMADFTSASLQGANLSLVGLEGAVLRDGEIDGANLRMAGLFGADLTGARLQGSDLTGAVCGARGRRAGRVGAVADMALIALRPRARRSWPISAHRSPSWRRPDQAAPVGSLAALVDARPERALGHVDGACSCGRAMPVRRDVAIADGYRARLTECLSRLMCRLALCRRGRGHRRRPPGHGRRLQGGHAGHLRQAAAPDCAASSAVGARLLRDLATAADAARGQCAARLTRRARAPCGAALAGAWWLRGWPC